MSDSVRPEQGVLPKLYIFSGLPGTGKTSLAMRLAERLAAVYLRIDTVEQALRDICSIEVEGEGYRLSYRVAADNLGLGLSVVADSCNPIELTRAEWEQIAADSGAGHINIEVVCSDIAEHRQRVEARKSDEPDGNHPGWSEVRERDYAPWDSDHIVIDTAGKTLTDSFKEMLTRLSETA